MCHKSYQIYCAKAGILDSVTVCIHFEWYEKTRTAYAVTVNIDILMYRGLIKHLLL